MAAENSRDREVDEQNRSLSSDVEGKARGLEVEDEAVSGSTLRALEQYGRKAAQKTNSILESVLPQERRAFILEAIQEFINRRPSFSAFLGINILCTGIPLALFLIVTSLVFISALVTSLVVAVLTAVLVTLAAVGVALVFLIPTVLFTTFAACALFFWGLAIYFILKWACGEANESETKYEPKQEAVDGAHHHTSGRSTADDQIQNGEADGHHQLDFSERHDSSAASYPASYQASSIRLPAAATRPTSFPAHPKSTTLYATQTSCLPNQEIPSPQYTGVHLAA